MKRVGLIKSDRERKGGRKLRERERGEAAESEKEREGMRDQKRQVNM